MICHDEAIDAIADAYAAGRAEGFALAKEMAMAACNKERPPTGMPQNYDEACLDCIAAIHWIALPERKP